MTPIHHIATAMDSYAALGKLNRDDYQRLIENEHAAQERAATLTTRPMHKATCVHCGTKFEHHNPNVITCSEECRKARKRNQDIRCKAGHGRIGVMKKCVYCQKQYTVEGTTQKYCSERCRKADDAKRKRNNVRTLKTTCVVCHKDFMTSMNTKAKTCGVECRKAYKAHLAAERARVQKATALDAMFDDAAMSCPFSALSPGIMGYPTYDDPQIDPFGCGHHHIALDMGVEQRRAA